MQSDEWIHAVSLSESRMLYQSPLLAMTGNSDLSGKTPAIENESPGPERTTLCSPPVSRTLRMPVRCGLGDAEVALAAGDPGEPTVSAAPGSGARDAGAVRLSDPTGTTGASSARASVEPA